MLFGKIVYFCIFDTCFHKRTIDTYSTSAFVIPCAIWENHPHGNTTTTIIHRAFKFFHESPREKLIEFILKGGSNPIFFSTDYEMFNKDMDPHALMEDIFYFLVEETKKFKDIITHAIVKFYDNE